MNKIKDDVKLDKIYYDGIALRSLSVPDSYVAYTYSKDLTVLENIYALWNEMRTLNYFLTSVVDLVNALGGVNVDVPYSFCEQDSQRRFDKYTQYVKQGPQKLNGEQALALSRNRHYYDFCGKEWNKGTRNDFVRGQNQQLVVQGIINKVKELKNVDSFYKLLSVLSNNMDTNMSTNQILSFYETGKKILFNVLDGNDKILKVDKLYLQTSNLMILGSSTEIYQKKSLEAVVNAMKINLGLLESEPIKTFTFDANVTTRLCRIK